MGLLLGFGLNSEALQTPDGQTPALALVLKLTELGLLTVPAGTETVRWLPPLNVSEVEVKQALSTLKQALDHLVIGH